MSTESQPAEGMDFFGRYLSVWVALCIIIGVAIGQFMPIVPQVLSKFEYASVSIPVALLIWLMIYPMMLKIDFSSVIQATKKPKGLVVTCSVNWLIKPFTMYLIAAFFFKIVFQNILPESLADEYLAGAILLGAAPCTAMVFVWSHLTKGDASYTLVQVAVNNLILLVAFTPIVAFLLGASDVFVPYDTLFLSVVLFVVTPLVAAALTRRYMIKRHGLDYFENVFLKKFDTTTVIGLLLTLVIIFTFQGDVILNSPLHVVLIAIPLILQTFLVFYIAYIWSKKWRLPHCIAAPAAMVGASNFFELAVAVAIVLFGLQSGATLVTVVGVLVEVPLMLTLVKIANKTQNQFPKE